MRPGVEAPFEDVAADDRRAGQVALVPALLQRADVDQDRAACERVGGGLRREALQVAPGLGEEAVDPARDVQAVGDVRDRNPGQGRRARTTNSGSSGVGTCSSTTSVKPASWR